MDKSKEPTEAQIKEFWEWCGLQLFDHPRIGLVWLNIDKSLTFLGDKLPIDLNNLFRYAVPRLAKGIELTVSLHKIHGGLWSCILTTYKGDIATVEARYNDPALALFWAIMEVIKSN